MDCRVLLALQSLGGSTSLISLEMDASPRYGFWKRFMRHYGLTKSFDFEAASDAYGFFGA